MKVIRQTRAFTTNSFGAAWSLELAYRCQCGSIFYPLSDYYGLFA